MDGSENISVIIAEGNNQFLDQLVSWLSSEPSIDLVGTVSDGESAVGLARRHRPDIVFMDMNLPDGSGIEATEVITTLLPGTGVIITSEDAAPDSLRRAMIAGAREFVLKSATRLEVVRTVREVHQSGVARRVLSGPGIDTPMRDTTGPLQSQGKREGQIITLFSPKGGVGETTVAVNLAMALRREQGLQVCLVDGSLPFGDIGVFLDLTPNRSIMDLVVSPEQIDDDYVKGALISHARSGIKVLLAPPRPEMAEMVTADQIRATLTLMRDAFDFTVVDTWHCLDERVLTMLELADKILLCFTLDLTAIKSAKVFLEISELLRFPPEKIVPVLIRSTGTQGIELRDVEVTLGKQIGAQISNDPRTTSRAINEGNPLFLSSPSSPIAQDFRKLAADLVADPAQETADTPQKPKRGRFGLFAK
jgi:pilus assembly protein CpaE